ncbi:MAG: tRNA (N6-isopentenyl adenosine(37)-C2)-methylthiotransferase MiaB [Deltaproteobacteria bacterium]|nr:tRNA (N6-isopentenyl adenosine(37)-C2)-methylthiotransferase MiaB [Deltaproteobacteria bacterium]RLB82520.1 MAG: tRNA (N6-isopentenyl adenosine(37)-C2)-methylthiotransferase MiaB [Deltaproteobacteria bacterium]
MAGSSAKRFYIKTMGCQMNVYDSEYVAQRLMALGWSPVSEPAEADLIILNTCTVRAKPEHKAATFIGKVSQLKKRRPELVLGVLGCLAQQEGAELLRKFPRVDFVAGPREIQGVINIVRKVRGGERGIVATSLERRPPRTQVFQGYFEGKVSAFITIMQGCDNFCSYCIVPYVRGREVSRPPHEILEETKILIAQGVKEITLLGQNVNSYTFEENGARWDFPDLLKRVSRLTGLKRLRFTTSHPKDLSPRLIQLFGEIDNLCPHIHLPFQAGSNKVLKKMNRKYTREQYIALTEQLRRIRPDIAITSDVMVGFPGETERDFRDTIELVRAIQFDGLFSFKYSDRKGTLATTFDGKVPEEEKARRLQLLQEIQKDITIKKNKALEGKIVEVLVEGESTRGRQQCGRTPTNKIVNFYSNINRVGQLVKVIIEEAFANSLRGTLIEINP